MRHDSEQQDDSDIEEMLRSARPDTTPRPGFQEELLERLLGDEGIYTEVSTKHQIISRPRRSAYRLAGGLAAMFIVAVGVWWFLGGHVSEASAKFADVLARIRQASTVTFDAEYYLLDGAKVSTHVDISYPGRIRVTMADGRVHITDMVTNKRLNLMPRENRAILFSGHDGPSYAEPLNDLRQAVASQGHLIDSETVNGLRTKVYQVILTGAILRIWVDPREDLPVRVESRTTEADGQETLMTLSNFSWNAQMPDSLFSMMPPAGYTLIDSDAEASEQSLIDLLKICSKDCFPDSLDAITVLNVIATKYPDECQIHTANVGGDARSSVTIKGKAQDDYKTCHHGLTFINRVASMGQWHYVGQGVTLGDKAAIVCWWQLPGDTKLRVVYGDLTMKDTEASELPANGK